MIVNRGHTCFDYLIERFKEDLSIPSGDYNKIELKEDTYWCFSALIEDYYIKVIDTTGVQQIRNVEEVYYRTTISLIEDEEKKLIPKCPIVNPLYCSCGSDYIVLSWAGGESFTYCRACKKERL